MCLFVASVSIAKVKPYIISRTSHSFCLSILWPAQKTPAKLACQNQGCREVRPFHTESGQVSRIKMPDDTTDSEGDFKALVPEGLYKKLVGNPGVPVRESERLAIIFKPFGKPPHAFRSLI